MASVVAVNVRGMTYVRVDAAAAWIYPRSPREALPPGVREVDISGGGVRRQVVNAADVARIVRWFGELNVTPPGMGAVRCMLNLSAHVTFSFRSASRAIVASAVIPSGGASGCNPVTFTVGGKAQTPLVDTTALPFAQRVERLLGVCFGAGPHGGHQPSPVCNKAWASQLATKLLHRFRLPPGAQRLAHEPHGDGGLLRSPATVSGSEELVDQHRFWRVRGSIASVEAFVKTHQRFARQTASSTAGGPGVPANHSVTFNYFAFARNSSVSSRQIEVTFVALPGGWTGIRADAQVVWIYPRTQAQFPPVRTQIIDVRAGSISRRITDYRTIDRIIYRFSRLEVVQPGNIFHCPAILRPRRPTVTIEFRAVNPVRVARAVASGTSFSTPCSPIHFSRGGRETSLVGEDFIQWLQGVLGVRFRR